jgi:uncharacterized protein YbgA (DUF1722 family)
MFIEQIFTLKCWRETLALPANMRNLVDFHTRHKLLILAHSPAHSTLMGNGWRRVRKPIKDVYVSTQKLLIEALRLKTTLKKNMNVLQHIIGYFKQQLTSDEKQETLESGSLPKRGFALIVPVTLLNHYVRKFDQPYLKQQVYLNRIR